MGDKSNKDLLAELGVEVAPIKKKKHSPREDRIIAGFEEIQRFVEKHERLPQHGEDKDIFERLYAIRLDQIRKQEECRSLVADLDHQGLLKVDSEVAEPKATYDSDQELLSDLGLDAPKENDITILKHVKPRSEKKDAEEIGTRTPCQDFGKFKPIFEEVQDDIKAGRRQTLPFSKDGSVETGNLFILSGQKVLIADVGKEFIGTDGRKEYRLRVIFDNGVESNQLMRSLQKRLWEDKTGRRITEVSPGPLFSNISEEGDIESGTIYVLRSKLDHPKINENRQLVHKIGVTGNDVKTRTANAKNDPTYLMAEVEEIATYKLFNINRAKFESIIKRVFSKARLNIEINDRFGKPYTPQEWFLVPLFIIDEVIDKIKDGTITNYEYNPEKVSLEVI